MVKKNPADVGESAFIGGARNLYKRLFCCYTLPATTRPAYSVQASLVSL